MVVMVNLSYVYFTTIKIRKALKDKENEHYVLEAENCTDKWQEADLADQERWIPSRQ